MDDNFYYRGMRKRYYQLARDLKIGYLEIHLRVSLLEAMRRNQERNRDVLAVPDENIISMALKLQDSAFPDHALTMTIENYEIDSVLLAQAIQNAQIPKSLSPAVKVLTTDQKHGVIHELDQALRKALSSLMKERPDLKKEAKSINDIRSEYIDTIRTQIGLANSKTNMKLGKSVQEEIQDNIDHDDGPSIVGLVEVWKEVISTMWPKV